ncbi:MAG: helix-hairpin-helix domain-containing protein [Gammaproteobacteria bacterium]|nr:MAG: helix-hairpin-helix domain-containing protein [Gammaproteobacteria bacterium]
MEDRLSLEAEGLAGSPWKEATWFDRLLAAVRRGLALCLGGDPWSRGLAGFAGLYLGAGLAGWCLAWWQGPPRLPHLAAALALVALAVRFLKTLEARLRPAPLPRILPREGDPRQGGADVAFWRALRRAGVNVRIARALQAGGVRDREAALARTDDELLAIPGVGPRTVARVRAVLRLLGR